MTGLHPASALALRRAVIVTVGVLVTLLAHGLAYGHLPDPVPAGAVMGIAAAGALLVGRHGGEFLPRGPIATALILILVQGCAHLAMWGAPWAFGFGEHPRGELATAATVLIHLLAAAVLVPLVGLVEQALAGALSGVRRLRRLLSTSPTAAARREPAPLTRIARSHHRPLPAIPARGPPSRVSPA